MHAGTRHPDDPPSLAEGKEFSPRWVSHPFLSSSVTAGSRQMLCPLQAVSSVEFYRPVTLCTVSIRAAVPHAAGSFWQKATLALTRGLEIQLMSAAVTLSADSAEAPAHGAVGCSVRLFRMKCRFSYSPKLKCSGSRIGQKVTVWSGRGSSN